MTFCDSGVTFIQGEKAEGKTNDVVEKSLNNILLKIFNFSNMYYYMGGVCIHMKCSYIHINLIILAEENCVGWKMFVVETKEIGHF